MKKMKTFLAVIIALVLNAVVTQAATKESYFWPAASRTVTQSYKDGHKGLDIGGAYGSNIYATKSGTVVYIYTGCQNSSSASKNGKSCTKTGCKPSTGNQTTYGSKKCCNYGYGNGVIIKHSDGSGYSMYAHMLAVNVKKGATVKQGTKIGTMGSTGNSSGVHLHFEMSKSVKVKGKYYAPVTSINVNKQSLNYIYTLTPTVKPTPTPVQKPSISISQSSMTLTAGGSVTLRAVTVPSGQTVYWSSSDSSVASVSNGVVYGKKEGTAIISAYMDYQNTRYRRSCAVTVHAQVRPELRLSSTSLSMLPGGVVTLTAITVPGNQTVSWSSSNSGVASVSNGKVTAYKAGTATITASMNYGGSTYRQSCAVTVSERTYTGYIRNTDGSLAINRTASTQYQIGSIPECAPCTVYPDRKVGNWVWVSYRGTSGYAYSTYISATAPASVQKRIYGTDGTLMINRTASTKYPIGSIPEGKYCTVFTSRKVGNWVWVCYNGIYGYAYSTYMR